MLEFNVFASIVVAFTVIYMYVYVHIHVLRNVEWDRWRFKLYEIRDQLTRRAAQNPTDTRALEAYRFTNDAIKHAKRLRFHHFVAMVIENYKQISAEVHSEPDEIEWIKINTVGTLIEMVRRRSYFYRFMCWINDIEDGVVFLVWLRDELRERDKHRAQNKTRTEFQRAYRWSRSVGYAAA